MSNQNPESIPIKDIVSEDGDWPLHWIPLDLIVRTITGVQQCQLDIKFAETKEVCRDLMSW